MEFKTTDDVLDFAIQNEIDAEKFYMDLSKKMDQNSMKEMFESIAREEHGHQMKLKGVRTGKVELALDKEISDLKISDYLVDIKETPDMSFQDALILAMKREQSAERLYTKLAEMVEDQSTKELLVGIAKEEGAHKLRFETDYDEYVLKDN